MNKLRITPWTSGTLHPSVWLAYWNGAECTGVMVYTEMIGDEPGTQRGRPILACLDLNQTGF
ncbi:hypothetical protein [Peribacillus frigoritolerans]|uniref:hypothetical protein n=1 Tax=Peribacillus frigoritolerans TaxID=450367 RepID=UPI003B8B51F4